MNNYFRDIFGDLVKVERIPIAILERSVDLSITFSSLQRLNEFKISIAK